jgi:hypothetical protein
METLAQKFVQQINDRNRINLKDKGSWFRGAYSTFKRPLSHIRNALSPAEKKQLQSLAQRQLCRFDGNFDVWIRSFIMEIKENHKFPIGCSQKLINILTKYYYVSDLLNLFTFAPHEHNLLSCKDQFHCPLDNLVLYQLSIQYFSRFNKIIKVVQKPGINKKGKKFGPFTKLKTRNGLVPWSQLDDWELYMDIQRQVREISNAEGYRETLAFEMEKLWKS